MKVWKNVGRVSITKIAQSSGLSEEEVEQCFKNLADANVWKILDSYTAVNVKTGEIHKFKVIKPLYLFYHPDKIRMSS